MNFKVIENADPTYNIDEVIKDYTNTDLTVAEIQKKHNITRSQWKNLIKKFHKNGVPVRKKGRQLKRKKYERMNIMEPEFKVKQTNDGRYQITGTKGYRVVLNNRFDALKHCNYLNKTHQDMETFRQQNIQYYTTLTKIKMLSEQIQTESGEIHVIELTIRIRELIRKVLP